MSKSYTYIFPTESISLELSQIELSWRLDVWRQESSQREIKVDYPIDSRLLLYINYYLQNPCDMYIITECPLEMIIRILKEAEYMGIHKLKWICYGEIKERMYGLPTSDFRIEFRVQLQKDLKWWDEYEETEVVRVPPDLVYELSKGLGEMVINGEDMEVFKSKRLNLLMAKYRMGWGFMMNHNRREERCFKECSNKAMEEITNMLEKGLLDYIQFSVGKEVMEINKYKGEDEYIICYMILQRVLITILSRLPPDFEVIKDRIKRKTDKWMKEPEEESLTQCEMDNPTTLISV